MFNERKANTPNPMEMICQNCGGKFPKNGQD